ncbi:MAG TPA: DNA polymerase IV [Acidimicrobiales bacterium]|nr:DNA polymerase IV [Acidimicrobiales bacterium]
MPDAGFRWVLHVDLDEFLAAVEVARRPELKGRPVVVGGDGDPTRRGVVATASYEAREFGIHSGMALRTALARCPDAVFLPSDPPAYEAVSEVVMAALAELPVVAEVLGWDEAFLGSDTDDPEALAADAQRVVRDASGLACSVGIGDNRLRAKIATGFAKRAGVYRLTKHNWVEVMGDRPPDALWGIGHRTAAKLAAMGITTVVQLARADPTALAAFLGPTMGPWYRMLAFGVAGSEVTSAPWVAKSRSRETTFQRDVTDRAALDDQVVALARRVAGDVAEEGRPAVRVAVKVRFAPFFTHTRSVRLPDPTADPDSIERAALAALDRFRLDRPVRLLGVRADLAPPVRA